MEKDIIELINKTGLYITPTDEQVKQYQSFREQSVIDQEELQRQTKVEESRKVLDKILAGKRKKLLKSGIKEDDIKLNPDAILQEIHDSCTFSEDNTLIQVPTEHPINVGKSLIKSEAHKIGYTNIIFFRI